MRFALVAFLVCAACGGHEADNEPYPTYQECFDDHTKVESLPVKEAIVVCCLEHPIAGVMPVCGNTAAECVAYLNANLSATSASGTDVMAACDDYIAKK